MKRQPTRGIVLPAALFLGALAPACALSPPLQNGGAAKASPGVQVAVVGQSCEQSVESDLPGVDLVETTVQVQVRNAGPTQLTIHREAFDLRGPEGEAIPTSTWCAREPLSVDPGQTRTFNLRFVSRGGPSCTQPMQLEPSSAITAGTSPIGIGAVTFVPRA